MQIVGSFAERQPYNKRAYKRARRQHRKLDGIQRQPAPCTHNSATRQAAHLPAPLAPPPVLPAPPPTRPSTPWTPSSPRIPVARRSPHRRQRCWRRASRRLLAARPERRRPRRAATAHATGRGRPASGRGGWCCGQGACRRNMYRQVACAPRSWAGGTTTRERLRQAMRCDAPAGLPASAYISLVHTPSQAGKR